MLPIGLASDHAGFELKQFVKKYLDEKGMPYKDYGTYSEESCDYPDFAHALARGIENGECEKGVAICGSGEGISMTLNKHQSIRAALVWIPEIAHIFIRLLSHLYSMRKILKRAYYFLNRAYYFR